MVECDLAKVEVAGSNPVSRSNLRSRARGLVGKPMKVVRRSAGGAKADVATRDLTSSHCPPIGAVAKW